MKLISLWKLFLVVLCILGLIAITESATAATLTVSNLNDSGAGSFRQALINAAATNDVIDFAPGVAGTITLTSGELAFTKHVTITGPGATNLTISGNNASRVFSVSSGVITISGLRIANGFVSGNPNSLNAGGGILNNSARLTVRNCEIVNNVHAGGLNTGQGGGVWHVSGTFSGDPTGGGRLLLQNCLFSGNRAIGGNGVDGALPNGAGSDAAPAQGGGLFIFPSSANSVTIQDCTFTNNLAIGGTGGNGVGTGARGRGGRGQGGAVFVGENTLLVAERSTFRRNEANGGARGAGSNTPAGGNEAQGQGGAIYVSGFAVLNDCTLDDNKATGGSGIDDTSLIGAQGQGGGLYFQFGVVYLTRCAVINNVAEGGAGGNGGASGAGEGGGLFVRYNGNLLPLRLINSTVALNIARAANPSAAASGGGIWTDDVLNVTNSTIAFNVVLSDANASGGGLQVNSGTTTLRNTLIGKNIANALQSDANGAVASASGFNLIGVGSGIGTTVTGVSNGTNNNQIGTSAAPIDPKMHDPALNGGLTRTCSLDADSPAVNTGDDATATPTDQRGFTRFDASDIGAYEFGGITAVLEILSITRNANAPTVLTGTGIPNSVHRLQASSDLSPGSFIDLPPTATADSAGILQFQDAATNLTQRFYRLAFP
ncbi:MAG: choice-of-anchor Q domain-containing protein [Verrucomicrobiota bacterium]